MHKRNTTRSFQLAFCLFIVFTMVMPTSGLAKVRPATSAEVVSLGTVPPDKRGRGESPKSVSAASYPNPTSVSTPQTARSDASESGDLHKIPFVQEGNIWVVGENGRNRQQLTFSGEDFAPIISPDETKVVFLTASGRQAAGAPSPSEIRVIATDGTHAITVISNPGLVSLPTWSPDSQKLAFVEDEELVVADLCDMTRTILANNARFDGVGMPRPAWSPDGRNIVCALEEAGRSTLWLINLDDGSKKQLTILKYQDTLYGFSPTGGIAYVQPSEEGRTNLHLIASGQGSRILMRDVLDFSWSPEGNMLAVRRSDRSLWLVRANGDILRKVSDEAQIRCWLGNDILVYSTVDGIYRTDLTGVDNRKLVDFSRPQPRSWETLGTTTATLDTPWRTQFSGICGSTNCGPASPLC